MNNSRRRRRRSIRLKNYDYRNPGAYFITVCVQGGACRLGKIFDGQMELNWRGHLVAGAWLWLAERYPYVDLDAWQVMPNHLHGILVLTNVKSDDSQSDAGTVREPPLHSGGTVRADEDRHAHGERPQAPKIIPIKKPVGRLIGAFKTVCTGQINRMQDTKGARFWQRDFFDRIIRNQRELQAIREYIDSNAAIWESDRLHPSAPPNRFNRTWLQEERRS
ncbi:MAG: transposase [Chloroflexota bacterium]